MKTVRKLMSLLLTLTLLLGCMNGLAYAGGTENTGKYVQDVFIAYGKTEDEAKAWLEANGWEPVKGDFNAGKNSTWDDPVAAVMGIRRTNDAQDAVTDMAVMNMTGGYDFPAYEKLIEKKQGQIDEFLDSFMPTIQEYRDNYNGKGGALGKTRADLVYDILNKFFDGEPGDPYAKNDTGMKLGDLFLGTTRREKVAELGEEGFNALGADEKKRYGDLQQILLESSGAAVIAIEQMLAMATDPGEETWLQRLSGLTGKELAKNLAKYVPEAAGQNLAASAISTFLRERFGDASRIIAEQYAGIREELQWYEGYCEENGLWSEDGESAEDYDARLTRYFDALQKDAPERYQSERDRFYNDVVLYENLYLTDYKGGWGDTLGDFFNPYDEKDYGLDADNFLTFAAAMSPGQRAALEVLSLRAMLLIGFADEAGLAQAQPDLDGLFGDSDEISVYSGINRGIFRGGVALTSRARMDEHEGRANAYDDIFDHIGILSLASYATAAVGAVTVIAGAVAAVKGGTWVQGATAAEIRAVESQLKEAQKLVQKNLDRTITVTEYQNAVKNADQLAGKLEAMENDTSWHLKKLGTTGKVIMCVGGALMILAAFVKGYQMYKYYQRTFTQIPRMIVDEADIVTYTTDSDGNTVTIIDFDQYVYYEAVKCNRQEVGEISDWQDGVDQYAEWGCGDVADLNGDFGQEWLALYTVKSPKKGDPILADSLTLQYGSNEAPKNCTGKLHKFTYTNAVDLGDTAYSFNNDKKGVYFFWDSDAKAYDTKETASAFTGGQLAMSGAAGLILGVLGTTAILRTRKKKEEAAA